MAKCQSAKWIGGFFFGQEEIISLIEVECSLESGHAEKHYVKWLQRLAEKGKPEQVREEYWQ